MLVVCRHNFHYNGIMNLLQWRNQYDAFMTLSGGREQSFHDKMVLPKDRKNVHTQTLAAASPGADSYEQLITVYRKLHLHETECYGYSTGWSFGATTLTKENKIQT